MLPTRRGSLVTLRTHWTQSAPRGVARAAGTAQAVSKLRLQSMTAFARPPPKIVASALLSYLSSFASFHRGKVKPLLLGTPSRTRNSVVGLACHGFRCSHLEAHAKRGTPSRLPAADMEDRARVLIRLTATSNRESGAGCGKDFPWGKKSERAKRLRQ